eukprot:TRINITY_DN17167_c0_g1_i1.p1 TRINITY_DN17167_c0_g1~~TRINITY_DN17167_c0_g1_i1.p1  ORF type:complete len:430 (+),score=149.74 TRINITY_DN17167_c0_g1_i1:42-1331(+)
MNTEAAPPGAPAQAAPSSAPPRTPQKPARRAGPVRKEVTVGDWVGTKEVLDQRDPLGGLDYEVFLRWTRWANQKTGEVVQEVNGRDAPPPPAVEAALKRPRGRRRRGCKDIFGLMMGYGFIMYTAATYFVQVCGGLWGKAWVEGEHWTELLNTSRWTTTSWVFMGVAAPLYLMTLWAYTKAVLTPPGILPLRFETKCPVNLTEDDFQLRICVPCNSFKPARTHHCATCNTCVRRYDHHCPWIGQCVGFGNHKVFLVMLYYVLTLILFFLATSWPCAYYIYDSIHSPAAPRVRVPLYQNLYAAYVLSALFGLFVLTLTVRHTRFTALNVTDIEQRKEEWGWSLGSTRANCGALCGAGSLCGYFFPCAPQYDHEGTSYVANPSKLAATLNNKNGTKSKLAADQVTYGATDDTVVDVEQDKSLCTMSPGSKA